MPSDRKRCHKRFYARWEDAAHDCRAIRRHNKRERSLRVYWSKRCRGFHLTHDRTRKATA